MKQASSRGNGDRKKEETIVGTLRERKKRGVIQGRPRRVQEAKEKDKERHLDGKRWV